MSRYPVLSFLLYLVLVGCGTVQNEDGPSSTEDPYLVVLGVAQDGGYPQAGCEKACCRSFWEGTHEQKYVVSLGIVDPIQNKKWLIEATPDIRDQLMTFGQISNTPSADLNGVFLTHAHMGHYTGLMHFGHEAMGTSGLNVYAMPRMKEYLSTSGPWNQMVNYENIILHDLIDNEAIGLSENITITPFLVPHRDEYSETVGFKIEGPNHSILFIPDINKWSIWEVDIREIVAQVDFLFLDGSFFKNGEIPGRDMSEFPHPFIEESMSLFSSLPADQKEKIYFIHLNHTNPALHEGVERNEIISAGYNLAEQFQLISL